MQTCLLGLGANLGDRDATLRAAIAEIHALPDVQVLRHSAWHTSQPVGGPPDQGEFLNAAAVIETTIEPLPLWDELSNIESRHGRQRSTRWSPRTLDIDLLLYGNNVSETELLTLPHPRMSFRPFVLEPAAQIAPKMLHPIIGWPIERLLLHLSSASNRVAVVSPNAELRRRLGLSLLARYGAQRTEGPTFATADHHWPTAWTTWLAFPPRSHESTPVAHVSARLPYAAAAFPKLTILLDAEDASPADKLQWSTFVRQPGRGPTLRLQTTHEAEINAEAFAAMEAVWPDLGPPNANRLES